MIVTGEGLRQPLEAALGVPLGGSAQFIGRQQGERLLVVTGYDNYTGHSVEMFVAGWSKHWPSKNYLKAAFHYPFNTLKCRRVTGLCDASDPVAIAMHEKVGFKREGLIREGLGDSDIIIFGMLKSECRWI